MSDLGPAYSKIQTAFKRDEKKIIIPGQWTLPEFVYLQDNDWTWAEKVDGTNIGLHWNGEKVMIRGRTDRAQLPADLLAALHPYTNPERWKVVFPDADDVTVYGEGYGPGIQKGGGLYRPDKGLIVFDVRVSTWWLKREDVQGVAAALELDVVPEFGTGGLNEAWNWIVDGELKSAWPDVSIEGIVGRPSVDLCTRSGHRLITKLKVKDWLDYQHSQNWEKGK